MGPIWECTPNMKSSGSKAAPARTPSRQRRASRLMLLSTSRTDGGMGAASSPAARCSLGAASKVVTRVASRLPVSEPGKGLHPHARPDGH